MQTEIHELQMMVVRLQEKLNKLQINNSENDSNPLSKLNIDRGIIHNA